MSKNHPPSWISRLPGTARALIVYDHREEAHTLDSLMGERGLLLVFIGDIWVPGNEHAIRWVNQITRPLIDEGVLSALVTSNAAHTLKGFFASSPMPLTFPLLADSDLRLRYLCAVERRNAIVLIDVHGYLRVRWSIDGADLPGLRSILRSIQSLNLPAR
ncbi:MAG: hypothetical protein KC547_10105 [Anaerolineae bacterium]|nr:hypothetical protein [Anaerolineae bacterium]